MLDYKIQQSNHDEIEKLINPQRTTADKGLRDGFYLDSLLKILYNYTDNNRTLITTLQDIQISIAGASQKDLEVVNDEDFIFYLFRLVNEHKECSSYSLQILSFLATKFPDQSNIFIEEDKIKLYLDILNSTDYYAIKSCKDLVSTLTQLHPQLFLQFFEFFIPKDTEEVMPSDIKYISSVLELLPQDDENVMEDLWTFFKSKTGTDFDLSIKDGVIYILSRAIQLNMKPIIQRYLNDPEYHQKNVLESLFSTLAMHISVAYSVLNSLLFVLPDDFDFENFIPFPRVQVNISTAKSDLCRDILIFLSHLLERAPFLANNFFIKDGLIFNVIDFMSYASFSIQEAACALMSRLIQVADPSFFENLDQLKIISDLINVLDENRQELTEYILTSITILFFRLPIELLRNSLDVDILLALYDADLSEKSYSMLKSILTALNLD